MAAPVGGSDLVENPVINFLRRGLKYICVLALEHFELHVFLLACVLVYDEVLVDYIIFDGFS